MLNQSKEVDQFLSRLEHPMKDEVEKVRAIILGCNDQITEHIKWNAPSFCYRGEDRVTFNLHAKGRIQLVFHRGVKASPDFRFDDPSGLMEFVTNDRAKVEFNNMEDVEAKQVELASLVKRWTEK